MIRRARSHLLIPFTIACGLLILPAASFAGGKPTSSSGGASLSAHSNGGSSENPLVHPADQTVSASGNGITVRTIESGLLTRRLRFLGKVPASDAGDVVQIERETSQSTWVAAARATVPSGGNFAVTWRANHAGRLAFKAVLLAARNSYRSAASDGAAPASAPSSPSLTITVYRLSRATYYGPGFFGHKTACGQTLKRSTLGVANRSLPCGTPVSILFHGRSITVHVIDRGPFGAHAYWDLTEATARALGMTGTSRIGTLFTG